MKKIAHSGAVQKEGQQYRFFKEALALVEKTLLNDSNSEETTNNVCLLDSANTITNGVSTDDLDQISSCINDKFEDVAKLGSLVGKLKEDKQENSFTSGDNLTDFNATVSLQNKDLLWAITGMDDDILGRKIEQPKKETEKGLNAEAQDYFKNLVKNTKIESQPVAEGNTDKVLYTANHFTAENWQNIRTAMESRTSNEVLPALSFVEEVSKPSEAESSEQEIIATKDGVKTIDHRSGIETITKDGKTIANIGQDRKIVRDGDTTTFMRGDKVVYEQKGNTRRVPIDQETEVVIDGNEAVLYRNGVKQGYVNPNGMVQERENAIVMSAIGAKNAHEALNAARLQTDLNAIDKPVIVARTNGISIIRDGKLIADFNNGEIEGKPPEATFFISENKALVRTCDGKLLIREKGKNDVELNRNQIEYLIARLGDRAKFISSTLKSMEMGTSVVFDENLSFQFKRNIEGIVTGITPQATMRFSVDDQGVTSEDNGFKTHFDTEEGKLRLESPTGIITKIQPNQETVDLENNELKIVDGKVEIQNSNVVIEKDGSVDLGNGRRIDTNGDVHLQDGRRVFSDGTIEGANESLRTRQAANLPTEKSLEVYMSFAKSLAHSVAGRANSGAVSLSDIALLRANMSILANYIGFFSQIGDLEVANTLRSSWSLVKASLDKAEPKVKRKQERASHLNSLAEK